MGQWSKRCNYDNMLGRQKIKLFIILQHFLYFIANNYTGFFSIFIASTSPRLIMLSRSCQKATAKIMILITWWSNQFCVVILVQPILPTYTSCTWKNLFLCHTILYCCSCATAVKSLSAILLQPLISKVYNIDIKKKKKITSGWHLIGIFIMEANYIYLEFWFHSNRESQVSPVLSKELLKLGTEAGTSTTNLNHS